MLLQLPSHWLLLYNSFTFVILYSNEHLVRGMPCDLLARPTQTTVQKYERLILTDPEPSQAICAHISSTHSFGVFVSWRRLCCGKFWFWFMIDETVLAGVCVRLFLCSQLEAAFVRLQRTLVTSCIRLLGALQALVCALTLNISQN